MEWRDVSGYDLIHGQEGSSDKDFFAIKIFVKHSSHKFTRDDTYDPKIWEHTQGLIKAVRTRVELARPEAEEQRMSHKKEFQSIYEGAGVPAIFMQELPNGYCGDYCCVNRPWFKVTSPIGHITIGWRKRVISIDWKETIIKKTGEQLFPDEDVTRWETGIHAWRKGAACEYLRKLHSPEALLP